MNDELEKRMQDSEIEWAKIQELTAERQRKDKRIISEFCAANDEADIKRTLDLLNKYNGMPNHDKEIVNEFNTSYPRELTVKLIHNFLDVKDLYRKFLESGGDDNE